ncbi:hypothetical protein ASD02_23595 [Ensifer sp. Root1252]|nr:hypothetical protein ASD02_23595 [Ensifer sp. Root1252]KRC78018.1 hypothetical protein ASE32_28205 [Ensifer sp. Root231]KRD00439.1 hypothetical protein ASE47_24165 [Ensifer sp. Root258]
MFCGSFASSSVRKGTLHSERRRTPLGKQNLVHLIVAAELHKLEVVKQFGQMLVSAHGGMEHILARDAERKTARIYNLAIEHGKATTTEVT